MCTMADSLESTTTLLLALIRRGFRFTHPHDASGDLIAIQGVRVHHNVIDLVVLRGENDAKAVRMPGDEPDILEPTTTLWRAAGRAHAVLSELLDLSDETPSASPVTEGCWVSTHSGHAVWRRATTA